MSMDRAVAVGGIAGTIVSIVAAIYKDPEIGLIAFGCVVTILAFYVSLKNVPQNIVLQLWPLAVLVVVAGSVYWFWPSTLKVSLFIDQNGNGLRDNGETTIQSEAVEITDTNDVYRKLTTDSAGNVSVSKIPRGEVRLKVRNLQVKREIKRGDNLINIGFLQQEDQTPPNVRIFLGDELFYPTSETQSRKIHAHIWREDPESKITKVEIDWDDGKGWENVDLQKPNMMFHLLSNEYKDKGRKTVRVKVQNEKGLSSFPVNKPARENYDFSNINIK